MAKKDVPHLRLRLDPRLLARLEKASEKSGRTLTGEISERLEASFRKEDEWNIGTQAANIGTQAATAVIEKWIVSGNLPKPKKED